MDTEQVGIIVVGLVLIAGFALVRGCDEIKSEVHKAALERGCTIVNNQILCPVRITQ